MPPSFRWQDYFSIHMRDAVSARAVGDYMDKIAATPAGRDLILRAQSNAATLVTRQIALLDDRVENMQARNPGDARIAGLHAERKALEDRFTRDEGGNQSFKIPIRHSEMDGFNPFGVQILFNPAQTAHRYLGTDGRYHLNTPLRALVHEIGHATQIDLADRVIASIKKRAELLGDAHTNDAYARELVAFRNMQPTMEMPNVQENENPVMRQVEPQSIDRGDYFSNRYEGQGNECDSCPAPTPPSHKPAKRTPAR